MQAADGEVLHPIGDAARLAGVSAAMLRLWERERLVSPKRSPGGHRLYTGADIRRLREIVRLRRLDRLNVAAIRGQLGDAGEPKEAPSSPRSEPDLGARLRALRAERGWSLAEVGEKSGLSISFLSAVERGQSSISVGSLFKLADAYGTTVPGLGADQRSKRRDVVHPDDRPRYAAAAGAVLIEDLIARPGALEAQRIEIQPGAGSEESYAHPGEEFVYVLSGCVTFWLDEREQYRLESGDALSFRSTRMHRWWNDSDEAACLLWINVPVVDGRKPDRPAMARWRRRWVDSQAVTFVELAADRMEGVRW
jgi:DNA-binding transcriptional MerR regulator/quercetin dioxygenase-like cupin family protein